MKNHDFLCACTVPFSSALILFWDSFSSVLRDVVSALYFSISSLNEILIRSSILARSFFITTSCFMALT